LAQSHYDASLTALNRACSLKVLHELERDENEKEEAATEREDLHFNLEVRQSGHLSRRHYCCHTKAWVIAYIPLALTHSLPFNFFAHSASCPAQCAAWSAIVWSSAVPRTLSRLEATLEPLSGRHHPSNMQCKAARDILSNAGVVVSLFRCSIIRHLLDLDKMVQQLASILKFTASVLRGATSLLDVSPSAADELLAVTFGLLELLLQPGDAKLHLTEAHVLELWRATLELVDLDHEQARLVALQAVVTLLGMPGILPDVEAKASRSKRGVDDGEEARAKELLSRLDAALQAAEPAPSLAARAAKLVLEAVPQLQASLESYGITAAVLRALQPQVTEAIWQRRNKLTAPPEGVPDSTAVAWLASIAIDFQSSSPLFLCQEYGLAWKATAALQSLQAVRSWESEGGGKYCRFKRFHSGNKHLSL